jgi:hypothetical protein
MCPPWAPTYGRRHGPVRRLDIRRDARRPGRGLSTGGAGPTWRVLAKPSMATLENYRALLHETDITTSLLTTAEIAVGS